MATPVYLDCAATTPVEPAVAEVVMRYMVEDFGNAGSRTHEFGARAKQAAEHARDQVAFAVRADRDEVLFTSGATESNNLALLGLARTARACGKTHVISSRIEHKSVLEPLQQLEAQGFEVTYIDPGENGIVDPRALSSVLRPNTFLVTLMHVNNETGTIQPVEEYASVLSSHGAYLHVDAAQSFGKSPALALANTRIDLISLSGHKIHAPKGVGALVARKRGFDKPPLTPLMYGGGQERGLRPGTLPVALIVGFGLAAEFAAKFWQERDAACAEFRRDAMHHLNRIGAVVNGDVDRSVTTTLNVSMPGIDSEALMVAFKPWIAVSNGSACTSSSYKTSYVLEAMKLSEERVRSAIRLSWCHLTPKVDWKAVEAAILSVRM